MKKDLQWFKDHEMEAIICILPNKEEKEITPVSDKDAVHYFTMQDRGYLFKKKIVVHKPIDENKMCVDSCGG